MTRTQIPLRALALPLFASALALAISATDASAKQQLPPQTNGLERCIIEQDGEGGSSTDYGKNRCCYQDEVADGEYLTMCVQCDKNWKNCTEEPGNPRIRNRFQKLLEQPTVDGILVPQTGPTRNTTGGAVLKRN